MHFPCILHAFCLHFATDVLHHRLGYCAQCWSHHSRVFHWPKIDDAWPSSCYFEGYEPQKASKCWFFQQGLCKFGASCKYSHS